ncbi:MAG: cytochrome c3 family protein [bacterium]|nr:cytochrome c3 family protein [bacterium]
MNKRSFNFILAVFFTLVIATSFISSAADDSAKVAPVKKERSEKGIDLKNLIQKDATPVFKPNIHSLFECNSCHLGSANEIKNSKDKVMLIEDEVSLCLTCHQGECLHPVKMDPKDLKPPMVIPANLPLDKSENLGKIVCSTCHQIHIDFSKDSILRDFPNYLEKKESKYKNRIEMCLDCHKDNLDDYNNPVSAIKHIHESETPDKKKYTIACQFCHKGDTEEIQNISNPQLKKFFVEKNLRAPVINLCYFCHNEYKLKIHYAENNAFSDIKLEKEIEVLDLPLVNGKFTCVTCHDQHNSLKNKNYLRSKYLLLSSQSKKIKPHKKDGFCLSCHEKEPKEGEKITYRFNGDWNLICNWCHKAGEARSQAHPVGIVLKEGKTMMKPKDFPLSADGKITCITCHYGGNYGCMENTIYNVEQQVLEGNEKRLRGWPYTGVTPEERRWQQCLKCHVKGHITKFNIHYQIDSTTGKVIESTCLFCHSSRPDEKVEGVKKAEFRSPVLFLCLSCHNDRKHPGVTPSQPDGVNHIVVPKEVPGKLIIPPDLHETDKKMIHCATCHNPHQDGLIGGRRGLVAGTERKRFLVCTTCHIGKF